MTDRAADLPRRPLNLAFGHAPTDPLQDHVDLIRSAEGLGFRTAWVADQTMHRDPYSLLTMCAPATQHIRLGIGVTNPYTRHPAMTARAVATLDELTGGRTVLGLGVGNRRELLDPLGFDRSDATGHLRDTINIVRGLLSGDKIDYNGAHLQARELQLDFRPTRKIPICIAGRGRRTLELAGELADGAIIGGLCTPGGVQYALDSIRRGCKVSGRDLQDVELHSWVTCIVSDNSDEEMARAAPMVAHIIGGAPADLFQYLEIPAGEVNAVRQAYVEGGTASAVSAVTRSCINAFAIVGSAEVCRERVTELINNGISEVVALLPAGRSSSHHRSLQRLASIRLNGPAQGVA